jgi:hypothetical protein
MIRGGARLTQARGKQPSVREKYQLPQANASVDEGPYWTG